MRPHRLELYRLAVQHPEAEVDFLLRAYGGDAPGQALLLKEDFAGTAAVAAAWVASSPHRQAMAVERHTPTVRWAWRRAQRELGPRADDLHLVCADVRDVHRPRIDVVAALNFSILTWHAPADLVRYLRVARRSLRPGGVFVADVYGGPGAMQTGVQTRRVTPPTETGLPPFEYRWEQRSYDHLTSRTDCRIHFAFDDGRIVTSAFRYDWRLWSLAELTEAMTAAGFTGTQVWSDRDGSDGRYRPVKTLPARHDWIAYVVGRR